MSPRICLFTLETSSKIYNHSVLLYLQYVTLNVTKTLVLEY